MSHTKRGRRAVVLSALSALFALTAAGPVAAVSAPPLGAGDTKARVGTYRFWDQHTGVGLFNAGSGAQTMGQTFTPERDASVSKFLFWVQSDPGVKFRGYVYEWDSAAQRATGEMLWSGAVRHTEVHGPYEPIAFHPHAVPVSAGTTYVVFASTLGIPQRLDVPHSAMVGTMRSPSGRTDYYDGGAHVYDDDASSPSDWTSRAWYDGDGQALGPGGDLTFRVVMWS